MKSVGPDSRLQYYRLSPAAVLRKLRSHKMGLTNAEAGRRSAEGPNASDLPHIPIRPQPFMHQVRQPVFGLLLAGACAADYLQLPLLVCIFLAILAIRIGAGVLVLSSPELDLSSLARFVPTHARVLRNGSISQIETSQLVVGDIVQLRPGDMVPADLRILTVQDLIMDNHALTGGSRRTHMFTHALDAEVPLALRNNLAFAGAQVVGGSAYGTVVAKGIDTELAGIVRLEQTVQCAPSPARTIVERYELRMALLAGFAAALVLIAGWLLSIDPAAQATIIMALCMASGTATIAIAAACVAGITYGKLRQAGLIARSIAAGGHIGAMDILLFNPAGFTEQPARVRHFTVGRTSYHVTGDEAADIQDNDGKKVSKKDLQQLSLFFEAAALAHHNQATFTALTEQAGLSKGRQSGNQVLKTFPYDAHRQIGGVVTRYGDDTVLFVQGSPDAILTRSSKIWDHGHVRALSVRDSKHHKDRRIAGAAEGTHASAVAYRILPRQTNIATLAMAEAEQKLTFLGSVEIEPSEHTHTRQLVEACGSELFTSILSNEPAAYSITSARLREMSDVQLLERLEKGTATFSQLTGEETLRLVSVAQLGGHTVGFAGASLEDLPAMKAAHIALAADMSLPDIQQAADALVAQPGVIARARRASSQQPANMKRALDAAAMSGFAATFLVLLSAANIFAQHVPLATTALQLFTFSLLAMGVIIAATARDTMHESHETSLRTAAVFGLFAGAVAYANYLLFFARAALAPQFLDPSSLLQGHAVTLSFAALLACVWINTLFVRTEHARKLRAAQFFDSSAWLSGLLWLTLTLGIVYIPHMSSVLRMHQLDLSDWAMTLLLVGLFIGMQLLGRHTRRHTRRAVVELHRQIHGKTAHARI